MELNDRQKKKIIIYSVGAISCRAYNYFFTYFQDGENFLKNSLNNQNDTIIQN